MKRYISHSLILLTSMTLLISGCNQKDPVSPDITLTNISVSGQKTNFEVGDTFTFGGVVTATYSDSSTKDVTDRSVFSGYDLSKIGEQEVLVSYEEGIKKTTTYLINVSSSTVVDKEATSIAVSGQKTSFNVGDTFTFGGVVTLTYSNGDTEEVTSEATFTGYDMSKAGEQEVTVNYLDLSTSYIITVNQINTVQQLSTPNLHLDVNSGLVTWDAVNNAEYYSYYINNEEIKTTTLNQLSLSDGQTLSIRSHSSSEWFTVSEWSKPITYFSNANVDGINVTIYFADSNIAPITVKKGQTYVPNQIPSKNGYTFEKWYLDPFYQEELIDTYQFNEDTILYPFFNAEEWIKDTYFWIKASNLITSNKMSVSTGWKFIPLAYDENKSNEKNKKIYSAVVNVSGATTSEPATYLVMDGVVDGDGRSYFKNGDEDFTIKSNGSYRIYFSMEYTWENNGNNVNCHSEQLSSPSNLLENEQTLPKFIEENATELEVPTLTLDREQELVSWSAIEYASNYQYCINNGEVMTTTSNNAVVPEGSFITVRSMSEDALYLSSRWSLPLLHDSQIDLGDETVSVYFYGSARPSTLINKGELISKPTNNPVKPGYTFTNWYTSIACSQVFDFSSPINKNTIIYAGFAEDLTAKFSLYQSNKTTKIGDLTVYENYSYNEFVIRFTVNSVGNVYVKNNYDNVYYGPFNITSTAQQVMYFSPDHLWDYNTANERHAYWTDDYINIYFSNNKFWNKVNFYIWNYASDTPDVSWPGSPMTFVEKNSFGEDVYKVRVVLKYDRIIFNDGGNNQTVDINLNGVKSGTGYYCSNKSSPFSVDTFVYE